MTKKQLNKKQTISIAVTCVLIVVAAIVTVVLIKNNNKPEPITSTRATTAPSTTEPFLLLSEIKHEFVDREVIGRVESEDLGISCDLVFGTSDDALRLGAGIHKSSSLPGYSTPPIIAGHVQTVFKGFQNAEVGKTITVKMPYGEYVYRIKEIEIMDKNDFSFDVIDEPCMQAIFYTCYPFGKVNYVKTDRMFLYCDYVSGTRILDDVNLPIPEGFKK